MVDGFFQLLQADQEDLSKDFADDAEEVDDSVVVAIFVPVEGNDFGINHLLRYSSFFPALTEDFKQWKNKVVLQYFCRQSMAPSTEGDTGSV